MNEPLTSFPAILGPPDDPPVETVASLRDLLASYERGIERAEKRLAAERDPAERKLIQRTREHRDGIAAQLRDAEGPKDRRGDTMLKADENGITISRNALKALMTFAAVEDPAEKLDVVSLRVTDKEVTARASDGHSALTLTGQADRAKAGDWDIVLPFLRVCAKALGGNDEIRIEPHGATIRNATVFRQAAAGEDFEEAEQIVFAYDASRLQKGFPWDLVTKALRKPRDGASGVAFDAELMARIALVQKAAGSGYCTLQLGADELSGIVIQCGDDATAMVMPMTSTGTNGKRGKRGKGGEEAGSGAEQAVLAFAKDMQRLADSDGVTVSIQAGDNPPVTVAEPRGKKGKKG